MFKKTIERVPDSYRYGGGEYTDGECCDRTDEDFDEQEHPSDKARAPSVILRARDEINNLKDLVQVCAESLLATDYSCNIPIAHVLLFFLQRDLEKIEKDLGQI